MAKIGIVGAGISGLVAARTLYQLGHQVIVFEKSRSYSGRCSTRRWNGHIVDHGAQYFTVASEAFAQELQLLPDGMCQPIKGSVIGDEGAELPATGGHRYYYKEGNNRMGKVLATGVEVRREQLISQIDSVGHQWQLAEELFDAVLITCPWPQTSSLLSLPSSVPEFIPCLTTFFEFDQQWVGNSAEQYAFSLRDTAEPLAWSACENYKSGRIQGDKTVFVVQASESFSRTWLEHPPEEYAPVLLERLKHQWKITQEPVSYFCHRWRYARKKQAQPLPATQPGIFIAGDSRVDSKIESVWLDGKKAAGEIDAYLNSNS